MTWPGRALGPDYDDVFDRALSEVGAAATGPDGPDGPDGPVVPFWPIRGDRYGGLMVIGRSVNGWVEDWPVSSLTDRAVRDEVVTKMRHDAEPADRCRMRWVTDLAGKTEHHYNTNRSAFWRVLRDLVRDDPSRDPTIWSSYLAWTNLYKISPAAGWNPGADLQGAQRQAMIELLRMELDAFRPHTVLAFTGMGWVRPFASGLGLSLTPRGGLVEAVGDHGDARWVVAKHPMRKPHAAFVDSVRAALVE